MAAALRRDRPRAYHFGQALLEGSDSPRKSERTRAAIRYAGCSLLDGMRLSSLTVAAICRAAHIAHGTFYIYFKDRHALVGDLLLRFVDYLQAAMLEAAKSAEADPVRASTAAYYTLFENNPGMMKCLVNHLEEFPESREAFHTLNREWATTVADAAERHFAQGGPAPAIPRDELLRRAYALGGMVDQYLAALLLNHDRTLASVSQDREAVIDTLTHIWKRGIYA